jgi:hypothetical protein
MTASTIEDLSVDYEEDGQLLSRQLDKVVLSKGAWSTILYRYQDWDRQKGDFGPEKYSIRRYQKRNGQYQQKSKFNISSAAQARKLIDSLSLWVDQAEASGNASAEQDDAD